MGMIRARSLEERETKSRPTDTDGTELAGGGNPAS